MRIIIIIMAASMKIIIFISLLIVIDGICANMIVKVSKDANSELYPNRGSNSNSNITNEEINEDKNDSKYDSKYDDKNRLIDIINNLRAENKNFIKEINRKKEKLNKIKDIRNGINMDMNMNIKGDKISNTTTTISTISANSTYINTTNQINEANINITPPISIKNKLNKIKKTIIKSVSHNDNNKNNNFNNNKLKSKLTSKLTLNPCYNKGYKTENITGTGNFTECRKLITTSNQNQNILPELNHHSKSSKCIFSENNIKIVNNTFVIPNRGVLNKILFHSKYTYSQYIKYEDLKTKIEEICSTEYSQLVKDFEFLNKNKNKNKIFLVCFDLTNLLLKLEAKGFKNKNEMGNENENEMGNKNKNEMGNKNILKLTDNNSKNITSKIDTNLISYSNSNSYSNIFLIYLNLDFTPIFISTLIISTLLLSTILYENKIIDLISKLIYQYNRFTKNESNIYINSDNTPIVNIKNIDSIIEIPNVRYYLFLDDNSYFKNKYGKNFELEKFDIILIKNEILNNIMKNNNNFENEINHKNQINEYIIEAENSKTDMVNFLVINIARVVFLILFIMLILISIHIVGNSEGLLKAVLCNAILVGVNVIVMVIVGRLCKCGFGFTSNSTNDYGKNKGNSAITMENDKTMIQDVEACLIV